MHKQMFGRKSTHSRPERDTAEVSAYQGGDAEPVLPVVCGHAGVAASARCHACAVGTVHKASGTTAVLEAAQRAPLCAVLH